MEDGGEVAFDEEDGGCVDGDVGEGDGAFEVRCCGVVGPPVDEGAEGC